MRSHGTIDSRILGVPHSGRRWVHTAHTEWAFEGSLFRQRYLTVGFDLFESDHAFSAHFAIPGLWVSVAFDSNSKSSWVARLRKRFFAKFGNEGRMFKVAYHDHALWWDCFAKVNESSGRDPWWMHRSVYMPWHHRHVYTEILTPDMHAVAYRSNGRYNYDATKAAKRTNSLVDFYRYVRKDGSVQVATATFYVERRARGFHWLRLPLFKRTSLWVDFDQELGERTGSWKGGVLGTGIDMMKGETPRDALRRMERERRFE